MELPFFSCPDIIATNSLIMLLLQEKTKDLSHQVFVIDVRARMYKANNL